MKWNVIKAFTMLLVTILVLVSIAYFNYFRDREIDFTKALPNELQICGETIYKNDPKYLAIYNWFKQNQKRWKNTPATYIQKYEYSGKGIYINVFPTTVVVTAQVNGSPTQVTIAANTTSIYGTCTKTVSKEIKHRP